MIGTEKLMNNLNHEKLEISIHSILNKILNLDNIKVEPILKRFKNSFLSKKILQLLLSTEYDGKINKEALLNAPFQSFFKGV